MKQEEILKKIDSFHFPRYEELPDLEIYMDQVLQLMNRYLAVFQKEEKEPLMTKTMINNYVKKGIIRPPIKKKYTKEHVAYLLVIALLKQVFSIQEISLLIQFQMHAYTTARAYNYFCEEMEACLKAIFRHEPIIHAKSSDQGEFEVFLIQNTILSLVEKIYVQFYLADWATSNQREERRNT